MDGGGVQGPGPRARACVAIGYVILLVAKVRAALTLGLFGDEAFYWQCGERPAWGYIDHPPATALLVRAGTALFGDTTLGVRAPFLLIGALVPFALFWVARPVVGRAAAWWAAAATLVLLPLASVGQTAIPDGPLLLVQLVFLGALERATRTGARRDWVLLGLACAVGLMTHYRFALYPLAALGWALFSRAGRAQWRRGGLWLAFALALPGLTSIVWVNLWSDSAPASYFFSGRHGSRFHLGATLEFVGAQIALVTPLLFAALCGVLAWLVVRARRGDERAALFAWVAGVCFAVFLITSPFEDSGLAREHWPVSGYVALLPFLPHALAAFGARSSARRVLALLTPALGGLVVLLALLEINTGWLGLGVRRVFQGWHEAGAVARAELTALRAGGAHPILVTDGYKLGANLEFELGGDVRLFVLDHEKNHQHGRALQFPSWGMGEAGLRAEAGASALVAVHTSQLPADEGAWMQHVASFFTTLEPVADLAVEVDGDPRDPVRFRFYRATVARAQGTELP